MAEDTDPRDRRHKTEYIILCALWCILFVTAPTSSTTLVSQELSWWEARARCKTEYDGDLHLPGDNLPHLQLNTSYWVGALETAKWKWTDGTSPFRYIGYLAQERVENLTAFQLPGNSVAECYSNCYRKTYFGLSETNCYCLGYDKPSTSTTEKENPCPGNVKDKCGNTDGLSVYKTNIDFNIKGNTQCVFGSLSYRQNRSTLFVSTSYCKANFSSVCVNKSAGKFIHGRRCINGLCVSNQMSTWRDARSKCNLVNAADMNKVKGLVKKENDSLRFWIGLHRTAKQQWINGTEVRHQFKADDEGSRMCLALFNGPKTWKQEWKQCNRAYPSLCVSNKLQTERITMTNRLGTSISRLSPTETITTEKHQGTERSFNGGTFDFNKSYERITMTNRFETSTSRLSTTETVTTEKHQGTGRSLNGTSHFNQKYGVYIGSALGVILLAGLLSAIVVILKRKEKVCFQKQQRQVVRFQPGAENLTYNSGTQETNQVSVGQAAAAEGNPDVISDLYSKVNKPQNKTSKINHEAGCKDDGNRYSDKGFADEDTYDRAGQFKNAGSEGAENVYNHLKPDEENTYDIAGRKPEMDRWDSTYSHVDASKFNKTNSKTSKVGAVCKETLNNSSDVGFDEEDTYDRAGHLKNIGYNHLKADEENEYDTAGRKPDMDR